MSATPARLRQALGLPAGSIRAILSLSVLALSWMLVLFAQQTDPEHGTRQVPMIFVYLQFLMILILGHYFTSRMTPSQDHRPALGLPRGTVRFLIMLTYGGLAYYLYQHSRNLKYDFQFTGNQILLVGLMFAGFIVGHYFTLISLWWSGPGGEVPGWVLDIQAWFAILAMIGLLIILMIYLVINPGISEPAQRIEPGGFEAALTAIVGFYFGALVRWPDFVIDAAARLTS